MTKKGVVGVLVILAIGASLFQYSKSRTSQLFGEITNRIETNKKIVALTFDDGPTETATERLLEILSAEGVKATFFLLGKEIVERPRLARKIVTEGHQVGNHSYSHPRLVFRTFEKVRFEIETTNELIREAGYKGEIFFRPPYGKKLFTLPKYLSDRNIKTITWDIEPDTYADTSDPTALHQYVVKNVEPGSIILLHPMYSSGEATIEALPGLTSALKRDGYAFVTVSDLLEAEVKLP